MARTEKIEKIRRKVAAAGAGHNRSALVGEVLEESGLLDRGGLNRQIEAILQDDAANTSAILQIESRLETLSECVDRGDIPAAADQVAALLTLELDDLRKAALLSLMVRITGKRRFDPIAAYILEKNAS